MTTATVFLLIPNLGGPEIFLILFIVLLLFGAKKLPELARGFGKGIKEFKDAAREATSSLEKVTKED